MDDTEDEFRKQLEAKFPKLVGTSYERTSHPTEAYNCIAWAAGENDRWWEPGPSALGYYWPTDVGWGGGVAVVVEAYKAVGFEPCGDGTAEAGFEKVAIYGEARGGWTHAARQLPDGRWTSKLGPDEDIAHEHPDHLSGHEYGKVWCYMRRKLP